MNKEKTKVVWIGRKRYSREKLFISEKLDWNNSDFTLLGLQFSTNLNLIPEMNYSKAIESTKAFLGKWENRCLTPLGKILLIKTKILSKFIHLFTTLPTSMDVIKEINDILYKFVWDNKPDKIKRKVLCTSYVEGGLKMINIFNFVKALKISWVKRLIADKNPPWYALFVESYGEPKYLTVMGGEWSSLPQKKMLNTFWIQVFDFWQELCHQQKVMANADIMQSCLWYNNQLSDTTLFIDKWFKSGINLVGDIVDSNGVVISLAILQKQYKITINFLDYYRVKLLVKAFINKHKSSDIFPYFCPSIPFHVNILNKPKTVCKNFYYVFMKQEKVTPYCKSKWSNIVNNPDESWEKIFWACSKAVQDNKCFWFQYKILYNILNTREYLNKIKVSKSDKCFFCQKETESVRHLFGQCQRVQELWNNLETWILNQLAISIKLNECMKILGYTIFDPNFWPLNFILLLTRHYIYHCSVKETDLNIYSLQKEIKQKFEEQKQLSRINFRREKFDSIWLIWQNLLTNI